MKKKYIQPLVRVKAMKPERLLVVSDPGINTPIHDPGKTTPIDKGNSAKGSLFSDDDTPAGGDGGSLWK